MKLSVIIHLLFAALALTLAGCCTPLQPIPEGVEVVPLTQHPLFPLETGRFWEYRAYIYRYQGGGANAGKLLSIDSNDYGSVILCDTLVRHNNKIYRAVLFNNDRELPYWSDSNQAAYFTKTPVSGDTTYFRKFLQYPIQEGDTFWIQRALAPFSQVFILRQPVVSITTDEDVRVPAGSFRCYGFSFEPQTLDGHSLTPGTFIDYYAPNVGRVMSLFISRGGSILGKTVLLRYGSFRNASP